MRAWIASCSFPRDGRRTNRPALMRRMQTGCAWWNWRAPVNRALRRRDWRRATRRATRSIPSTRLRPTLTSSDQLYFLIGADAFAEIETWRRWPEVVRSVEFIRSQPPPPPVRNSQRGARAQARRPGIADVLLGHPAKSGRRAISRSTCRRRCCSILRSADYIAGWSACSGRHNPDQ